MASPNDFDDCFVIATGVVFVPAKVREQTRLEKTTESSIVLTTTDLPLPAASHIKGFDVRYLGM